MPTIEENRWFWDESYHWRRQGDEWSAAWGDAETQWYASILPRVRALLPAGKPGGTILEIGSGFGRWARFLKDSCERLVLVDLSEKCVRACEERFASSPHVSAHVTDGSSLAMVPDGSIDFVFSFDSLVHAEEDVILAYLRDISKKLKKDGAGFIHHSNAGELGKHHPRIARPRAGCKRLMRSGPVENVDHWRAYSMTAAKFRRHAEEAGLRCVSQELVNWLTEPGRLTDCFSVVVHEESPLARPNKISRNGDFMKEAKNASRLSRLYGARSFGRPPRPGGEEGRPSRRRPPRETRRRMQTVYKRVKAAVPVPVKQAIKDKLQALPREPVREAAYNLLHELRLAAATRGSADQLRELQGKKGLKIHLGAGKEIKPGWVNIDLTVGEPPQVGPDTAYVNHDLRLGLPLAADSCDYVYSSHFFEHLEYGEGMRLMRDCHRVLRPGGVFRVALPTFKNMFAAYVGGDAEYFAPFDIYRIFPDMERDTDTLIDHVNYGVYQFGEHKHLYDEEKAVRMLRKVGFRSVEVAAYEEGMDPGNKIRRRYSFYVEAVK